MITSRSASTTQTQEIAMHRLWWIGLLAIAISVAINTVVRTLAVALFTISPEFSPLTWQEYLLFTIGGVVLAVVVFAVVGRFAQRPIRTFLWIASIVLVLSFGPDLGIYHGQAFPGTTIQAMATLMVMHLPPALSSIFLLTKFGRRQ